MGVPGRSLVVACALVVGTLAPRRACAQDDVQFLDCPAEDQFAALLRVELDTLELPTRQAVEALDAQVSVTCDEDGALVRVEDPARQRRFEERIGPSIVQERGFARRAALTVVELLSALTVRSQPEPEPAPAPEPPPTPPPETRDAPLPPPPEPPSPIYVEGGASGRLRLGGQPLWVTGGFGLDVHVGWWPWLSIGVDLEAAFGEPAVERGSARTTLLSGALEVLLGPDVDVFRPRFGLGYRVGALVLEGRPNDGVSEGRTGTLAWSGPFVVALARVWIGSVGIDAGVEAGWVVAGSRARVDDVVALDLGGPWVTFRVGGALSSR